MKFEDLPTNDDWTVYDWASVLSGTDDYGPEIDTTAYEILTQNDKGQVTAERIFHVEKLWVERGDYSETDVIVLAEATEGWLTLVAWCDTTGWDCQSGGRWHWAVTRDDAIWNGLDSEARACLGLELPAGGAR